MAEARLYRSTIDVGADQGYASDGNARNKLVAIIKSRLDVSNFFSALKDPLSYVNAALLFIVNIGYR